MKESAYNEVLNVLKKDNPDVIVTRKAMSEEDKLMYILKNGHEPVFRMEAKKIFNEGIEVTEYTLTNLEINQTGEKNEK